MEFGRLMYCLHPASNQFEASSLVLQLGFWAVDLEQARFESVKTLLIEIWP